MGDGTKIEFHRYARRSAGLFGVSVDTYVAEIEAGRKWCSKCRAFHGRSEFGTDPSNWDGLNASCRLSFRVKQKRYVASFGMAGKTHSAETREKMSAARAAAGNANWKGGKTAATRDFRHSLPYRRWRLAVFARDGRICQECDASPKRLTAHHIKDVKTYPELSLDVDNGVVLCEPCHKKAHARENTEIKCGCGCGAAFMKFDSQGHPRRFAIGHYIRRAA